MPENQLDKRQATDEANDILQLSRMHVNELWLNTYRKLTGRSDKPGYKDGSLWWWIAEYQPNLQTEILYKAYELGYKDAIANFNGVK